MNNTLTRFAILVLAVLMLAACGGSGDEAPPPTVASLDELATQAAAQQAAVIPSPTPAPLTATPVPPTDTPPVPTDTPVPTETVAPSATVLSEVQQGATEIALTNAAIRQGTQTAQASVSPSAIPPSETVPPSETAPPTAEPLPDEPFQVVFYSDRSGSDDIYLMTLNGVEHAIVTGAANEREPSCSPDGRSVVYASDATGTFQLYLQRLDRTDAIPLTSSEGMNFAPIFSPDGSTIAFVSTRSGGIPTIWLMDVDGGNPRQVTTELGRDTSPSWGPDGRQLLFSNEQTGPWDMYITVLDTEVPGEFPVLPPEFSTGNQLWPFFDPMGERIAYTNWDDLNDPQTADIYLLDFEEPAPVAIRAGEGADIAWSWGDDTHLLASVGGPDDVQIALVDIETGEAVRLTHAGTFNGGARLCTVDPAILPVSAALASSPTPEPPTSTPTPTATPEPPTDIPAALIAVQGQTHTVQQGENLMQISALYGVSWQTLADINTLADPNRLKVGQKLTVPVTRRGRLISGYQHPDSDIAAPVRTPKEILVRLNEQTVYAYEDGKLIHTATASTGLPTTPTVTGKYAIYSKIPAQTMAGPGYYLPGVPYVMYFYQGYGLHGAYWHNNFGEPMSHGCVNLPISEAKWFYDWAEVGTPVVVRQ